ncbi:MAG: ATP-binding protein, partial [Prevotella sp.]|nr:ATP-binding protein [Prevotella sp.]
MDDKAYLQDLIAQGEHRQQDFKYKVQDAYKLAISVSAFANTAGGRLLIGVRDDGTIAGVSSEE